EAHPFQIAGRIGVGDVKVQVVNLTGTEPVKARVGGDERARHLLTGSGRCRCQGPGAAAWCHDFRRSEFICNFEGKASRKRAEVLLRLLHDGSLCLGAPDCAWTLTLQAIKRPNV